MRGTEVEVQRGRQVAVRRASCKTNSGGENITEGRGIYMSKVRGANRGGGKWKRGLIEIIQRYSYTNKVE